MSDHAYENAIRRRNELINELKEIETFLALYKRFDRTKREETNSNLHLPRRHSQRYLDFSSAEPDETGMIARLRKKNRGNPQIIADAVEQLIREHRRPMVRTEIAEALEQRGIGLPSGDKARYVGTILWRNSDRFLNLEGRGYWLQDLPIPDEESDDDSMVDFLK